MVLNDNDVIQVSNYTWQCEMFAEITILKSSIKQIIFALTIWSNIYDEGKHVLLNFTFTYKKIRTCSINIIKEVSNSSRDSFSRN